MPIAADRHRFQVLIQILHLLIYLPPPPSPFQTIGFPKPLAFQTIGKLVFLNNLCFRVTEISATEIAINLMEW